MPPIWGTIGMQNVANVSDAGKSETLNDAFLHCHEEHSKYLIGSTKTTSVNLTGVDCLACKYCLNVMRL